MKVMAKLDRAEFDGGGASVVSYDPVFGIVRRVESGKPREYFIGGTDVLGKANQYVSCNASPLTVKVMVTLAGSSTADRSDCRPLEEDGLVPNHCSAHFTPEQVRVFAQHLLAAADEAEGL